MAEPLSRGSLSSDAENRIRLIFENGNSHLFRDILDVLLEDQSKQGLRLHKGFPLYWIASEEARSSKEKALEIMLAAFVEDVLSQGHNAFPGFAATSLRDDFGVTTQTLLELKEYVMEKVRFTLQPNSLLTEFLEKHAKVRAKSPFIGVTDESRYESIAAQVEQKLKNELRASIKNIPGNEAVVQDLVFLVLKQIDPLTEREKTIVKFSGKDYKADFSMGLGNVGVEVKLIRDRSQQSAIIDEISADIPPYLRAFKKILFVVYDACGAVSDDSKFTKDLKGDKPEVEIVIIKH